MKTLSVGKYRALQKASTTDGIFCILAIDHQDALRRANNGYISIHCQAGCKNIVSRYKVNFIARSGVNGRLKCGGTVRRGIPGIIIPPLGKHSPA